MPLVGLATLGAHPGAGASREGRGREVGKGREERRGMFAVSWLVSVCLLKTVAFADWRYNFQNSTLQVDLPT